MTSLEKAIHLVNGLNKEDLKFVRQILDSRSFKGSKTARLLLDFLQRDIDVQEKMNTENVFRKLYPTSKIWDGSKSVVQLKTYLSKKVSAASVVLVNIIEKCLILKNPKGLSSYEDSLLMDIYRERELYGLFAAKAEEMQQTMKQIPIKSPEELELQLHNTNNLLLAGIVTGSDNLLERFIEISASRVKYNTICTIIEHVNLLFFVRERVTVKEQADEIVRQHIDCNVFRIAEDEQFWSLSYLEVYVKIAKDLVANEIKLLGFTSILAIAETVEAPYKIKALMVSSLTNYLSLVKEKIAPISLFEKRFQLRLMTLNKDKITYAAFINIINNALALNKLEFVTQFIEDNQALLPKDVRREAVLSAKAILCFHLNEFNKFQDYINAKGRFLNAYDQMSCRVYLLLCYLETEQIELLEANIDSTRKYLQRGKVFSEKQINVWVDVLKAIRAVHQWRYNYKKLQIARKKIDLQTPNLYIFKVWIFNKIEVCLKELSKYA